MARKDYQKLFDTAHLDTDLKKRSLKSGAVTLMSQGLSFVIQLGSTMILARILTPEDYGMLAMVLAITGLAGVLLNLGLSTATIQRAEITHEQVSTLFWINAGIGALLMVLIASLSPVIAWFYKTPELAWVAAALSCNFLINGLSVQHHALLNRQMRFVALAVIHVSAMLVGIVVAIIAALQGFGYWALVLNSLTVSACTVAGAWFATKWSPGLPRRDAGVGSMVKFGADIVGFNVINYFSRNLDNILIGRYSGSAALGLYSKAYQLMMMPITNLRDPLNKVAMPSLSRLQNKPNEYKNYYLKCVGVLAFISMPVVVFMYVSSDRLILLLLGSQWIGASEIFKILSIAAFIQPVSSTVGMVLLSTGRGRRYLTLGGVNSGIISIFFVLGLPWGAKGVAIAYTIATYAILYPTLFYTFQNTKIKIKDFVLSIYRPIFSSLIMGCSCFLLQKVMTSLDFIIVLILSFIISLVLYLLFIFLIPGGGGDLREYFSYCRLVFSKSR